MLDATVRVALYFDRQEGEHFAGEKAHEVEPASDARHLNLPIETAHGDRAVVAHQQPQFHVLFGPCVRSGAIDDGFDQHPCMPAEYGSTGAMKQVLEEGVRQAPLEASGHSLVLFAASM